MGCCNGVGLVEEGINVIRAFLALDISEEVKKNLGAFAEPIAKHTTGVKWVKPENFHVTVKFFGDVDEEKMLPRVEKVVQENLRAVQSTTLRCAGIGCFPKWQYPRVIWAGLSGEMQGLIDLQKKLESAFEKLGFASEPREFQLHLTLARIKGHLADRSWLKPLEEAVQTPFGTTLVGHLTLYKSVLTKIGPVYTAVRQFPFST